MTGSVKRESKLGGGGGGGEGGGIFLNEAKLV